MGVLRLPLLGLCCGEASVVKNRYLGDEILPSYVGITMIHYKDPYWLGFVFVGGDFF